MAGSKFITHVERFFKKLPTALVTEESTLHEIARDYPSLFEFLERRYAIRCDRAIRGLSLQKFSKQYHLPPPQILFMEIQLDQRSHLVKQIQAKEAQALIVSESELLILDVREEWELKMGAISNSNPLNPAFFQEVLSERNKLFPILLYCHFGIRSLDAGAYLGEQGFKKVYVIKGGIDAWSQEVDSSIPRYTGAYC